MKQTFHPYKVSAVHAIHVALGARWRESGGWRIPASYGDPQREAASASGAVGLQDVSDSAKLDLKGLGVERLLRMLPNAGVSASVLRIAPSHALIVTSACGAAAIQPSLSGTGLSACVHVTDVTSALSAFMLVGPKADDVLSKLTALDLRQKRFPDQSCASCELAKVHAILFRHAWGSLPAYLILVGRDVGSYVWATISAAGKNLELAPIGATAADCLHARAGAATPVDRDASATPAFNSV